MTTPITGLNSSKIGKDQKKAINEQSLFYCMDCNKCMTLAQSQKISCVENDEDDFIDIYGNMFYSHNFEPQWQDADPNAEDLSYYQVDTDSLIRFFRERYRLCWKEIYLKFIPIIGPQYLDCETCINCYKNFQLCDIAGCESSDKKLHKIDFKNCNNLGLNLGNYLVLCRQLQIVDTQYPQEQIEEIIKLNKAEISFQEPQSMNFDKKLSEIYKEFKIWQDQKREKKGRKDEGKPTQNGKAQACSELEDLLFSVPRAAGIIKKKVNDQDFLKKINKEAKQHVKEQQANQPEQPQTFKIDLESAPAEGSKKKMSPRSLQKVKKVAQKRLNQFRRDTVAEDDDDAMSILMMQLKN